MHKLLVVYMLRLTQNPITKHVAMPTEAASQLPSLVTAWPRITQNDAQLVSPTTDDGSNAARVRSNSRARACDKFDHEIKLLVLGGSNVGKSCVLLRYVDNKFAENLGGTIGIDFQDRIIEIHDPNYRRYSPRGALPVVLKARIWDTAGQERFRSVTTSYYRATRGVLLVFDVSDRQSFDDIGHWCDDAKKYGRENIVLALFGNKTDIGPREVSECEARAYADSLGMLYEEGSAKEGVERIDDIFSRLLIMTLEAHEDYVSRPDAPVESLVVVKPDRRGKRCSC